MPRQKRQHLKRRKDGRYCCVYLGKQFMGWTEDEVFAKREEYKRQLRRGSASSHQTLGEYAMYWLPIHKSGVKPSTYNAYVSILTRTVKPISGLYLDKLTSDHIAEALSALTGKSASYIRKAKILLTEILDSAADAGYMTRNPARAPSVKPPKGKKGTHRAITNAERALIESTPHRMRLAALIMLYCGLRRGELLGLRAEDIQGDILTVRRAVYFVSNQPIVSEPKTVNSVRTVPAPDFILASLPKMNRDCYVLTGTTTPMTESGFSSCWQAYLNELSRVANNGLQRRWWGKTKEHRAMIANGTSPPPYRDIIVRPHDLRHSYATWLRDLGVDIHQAIIWLGHADEKMILRIYDHPGERRETDAKNLLKSAFHMQIDMQDSDESL